MIKLILEKCSLLISILFILVFLLSCGSSGDKASVVTPIEESATYVITFSAAWSAESHPTDFPGGAHFSALTGLNHNSNAKLWAIGEIASAGIEHMAETGSVTTLKSEIGVLIDNGSGGTSIVGGGLSISPGTVSVTITITKDMPLVSLVTMIAPSPDWFVGIDSVSLVEDGIYVSSKVITLQPYDAGSDDGSDYTSVNADSQPKNIITEITAAPFTFNNQIAPIGTLTFTKQ